MFRKDFAQEQTQWSHFISETTAVECMTRSVLIIPALLLSAILCACNGKGNSMVQTNAESARHDSIDRGLAHLNPNPTARFRIRLKINDAPGPFQIVKLGGQFDVRNKDECGKINLFTGTAGRISSSERLPLTRISDSEYEAVLELDRMQDEDYFDRGVCHWELIRAYAVLIAADEVKDTSFAVSLPVQELLNGGAVTRYFLHLYYPRVDELDGYSAASKKTPDEFLPEYRDHLFSMTLSSLGTTE
ncbi:hypothetical protein RZA67_16285 [Stenotrophomonas sp. C3(2023)]|uniref:hypothetical protein n=1 Tax=Stenotrophomonas sp. C3(2023) TaxID=3080277 RepID=UPI00293C1E05|nr:hypothetical protein [Stenotrophomonas sp. C3(2023)]MDV3470274.1 hypothetical protein [Stenotrophomonas sp. C3(2023)]